MEGGPALSSMALFSKELGWCLTPRQVGDHLPEEARGLERLAAGIEIHGGGDAAMTEHAANQLIIAGIGLEHDVGGGVPELVRRDLEPEFPPKPLRAQSINGIIR